MDDKRGKVTEVDGIQNLGRSKIFHCMRRDISVCVMVGGSGGVGESDGTGVFRSPLLVCGGDGIFGSSFLVVGR